MAYIYKITNTKNNKCYIGKTEYSVEKRFKQHLTECTKDRCEKRPLYLAINKYGKDCFKVETLEETDTPSERECYYIKKFNSYKNGYNATLGGDGKKYLDIDEELLIATYIEETFKSINKIAKEFGICVDSVRNILHVHNIDIRHSGKYLSRSIKQYTKDNVFIKAHKSAIDAAKTLGKNDATHINACARGERKSAYGFKWKY